MEHPCHASSKLQDLGKIWHSLEPFGIDQFVKTWTLKCKVRTQSHNVAVKVQIAPSTRLLPPPWCMFSGPAQDTNTISSYFSVVQQICSICLKTHKPGFFFFLSWKYVSWLHKYLYYYDYTTQLSVSKHQQQKKHCKKGKLQIPMFPFPLFRVLFSTQMFSLV